MRRSLVNHKTGERYVISGCLLDPNPPASAIASESAQSHGQLPQTVSLRRFTTPVKDQQETNSCVANAFSSAYEYLLKRYGHKNPDVSRLFIYYNSRVKHSGPDRLCDSGVSLKSAYAAAEDLGCCIGHFWPFDISALDKKPSSESYQNGHKYLLTDGHPIDIDLQTMKSCLADGYPFVFGIFIFKSFHQASDYGGRVPMPGNGESLNSDGGTHAMIAIGYSDEHRLFIVKNSWGLQWGDKGYCYIPYDYLADTRYCHSAIVLKAITRDDVNIKIPHTVEGVQSITSPGDRIQGVHETRMSRNSQPSSPVNQYFPYECPSNAIDEKTNTKYINWGSNRSGLHSGFYIQPKKGRSIVTAIQFVTGNDFPSRDPLHFTLEGSNASWEALNEGSSWVSICYGRTGLEQDPGRSKAGPLMELTNSEEYENYRLLITAQRGNDMCVQYTQCTLFGRIVKQLPEATKDRKSTGSDDIDNKQRLGWNVDPEIPQLAIMRSDGGHDTAADDDWTIETEVIVALDKQAMAITVHNATDGSLSVRITKNSHRPDSDDWFDLKNGSHNTWLRHGRETVSVRFSDGTEQSFHISNSTSVTVYGPENIKIE